MSTSQAINSYQTSDLPSCTEPVAGSTYSVHTCGELTYAEFFAGIGLMRMGLEKVGWRGVFANDFDAKKRRMYEDQFGHTPHLTACDIRVLEARSIPEVMLATSSFPCTDLSLAGARDGLKGRQSSAFWAFIAVLEHMVALPPIVLIENVPGFLTSNGGKDIREALLALNRLGYAIDLIIVDAIHFLPHSRARLFIVAHLRGLPAATTCAVSVARPQHVIDVIEANPDIRWSIRELAPFPIRSITLGDIIEPMDDDDPRWWSQERQQYLLGQMGEKHRAITDEMIASDMIRYGTIFRRMRNKVSTAELRTDGIAGCLRTPTGGSARQILMVAGNGNCRVRLITPREAANLMGAGDYAINVSVTNALFGFGDAVCVDVVEWIATNYLIPLVCELARSVGPDGRDAVPAGS